MIKKKKKKIEKNDEDGSEHTKNWMLTSFWCFKSNQATFEMSKLKRFLINVCNCQWSERSRHQFFENVMKATKGSMLNAEKFSYLEPGKTFLYQTQITHKSLGDKKLLLFYSRWTFLIKQKRLLQKSILWRRWINIVGDWEKKYLRAPKSLTVTDAGYANSLSRTSNKVGAIKQPDSSSLLDRCDDDCCTCVVQLWSSFKK